MIPIEFETFIVGHKPWDAYINLVLVVEGGYDQMAGLEKLHVLG